jgi:copper chaperone
MQHATLTIEGMSCEHCVRAVQGALEALPGVEVETVEIGTAEIAYEPERATLDDVARAVAEEGYRVAGTRAAP